MRQYLLPFFLISCATQALPEPAISNLGIKTGAAGLIELSEKVSGREDAVCTAREQWLVCPVRNGAEVYTFAAADHPAYPAALFRGFVDSDEGVRLEERGWFSGDDDTATSFFNAAKSESIQPVRSSNK